MLLVLGVDCEVCDSYGMIVLYLVIVLVCEGLIKLLV